MAIGSRWARNAVRRTDSGMSLPSRAYTRCGESENEIQWYTKVMRTIIKDGIEMAELNAEERAFLHARIASLDRGQSQTYTEEEIDEIWRLQDLEDEQIKKDRAA